MVKMNETLTIVESKFSNQILFRFLAPSTIKQKKAKHISNKIDFLNIAILAFHSSISIFKVSHIKSVSHMIFHKFSQVSTHTLNANSSHYFVEPTSIRLTVVLYISAIYGLSYFADEIFI